MLNSEPIEDDKTQDVSVQRILRSGAVGAIVLAGIATVIVLAMWFAFYMFVFVPRAGAP